MAVSIQTILKSSLPKGDTGFIGSQGDIGYTGSQGDIGYTGSQGDIGYTGSSVTASIYFSDDPPVSPVPGELWWETDLGTLKIFYQDEDSAQWVDAVSVIQGDVGYTGSAGGDGYTGSQGNIGYTGSQGIPGEAAAIGYTGSQGYTGSAGSDGSDGTSVTIVGTVASSTDLPDPYVGDIGDGYITDDTGYLWVWGGSSWTNVGRIVGYTGSAGPAGGYTGSRGADGSTYISVAINGSISPPLIGSSRFYPPNNININTVYANVSTSATAGDFTFIIKKNGTTIGQTFTISQNQYVMSPVAINVNLSTTDYLTIDITGDSATDLFVKIKYTST